MILNSKQQTYFTVREKRHLEEGCVEIPLLKSQTGTLNNTQVQAQELAYKLYQLPVVHKYIFNWFWI